CRRLLPSLRRARCPPRGRTGILACYMPAGILACRRLLHCDGQDARRVVEQASLPVTCRQASLPVGGCFIAPGKMPAATRQPGMAVLLCRVVEQASLPVTCRQASLPVGGCFLHCAGQDARRDATARDGCPTLPRGRTGILACYVPAGILACR